MLSKSLDEVDNEDWVCELGEAMGEHVNLYNNMPEDKVKVIAESVCTQTFVPVIPVHQNFFFVIYNFTIWPLKLALRSMTY